VRRRGGRYRAGNISVAEVDHARNVLERECVRLAALNRTDDDLEAMRAAVEDSTRPELDTDEWLATDLEFHTAISKAAKNGILELAMTAVHLVRPRTNSLLIRTLEREPVSNQHRLMYEKIRDRDPEGAVAAFEAHFDHLVDVQRRALLNQDSRTLLIPEEAHPTPEVLQRRRAHDGT
jgi:GntR family transcriptional repressor for pyruvate dehydrogenase complex